MSESVKDTLELPLVLGKFGITTAQSVIEWEDKLGLKSVQEAIEALLTQAKHDWENPAAYEERSQAAKVYTAKVKAYEKAFNAAHYRADNAKTAGYISAEALQFVFGSEAFKAGAQGVKAAGRALKESKCLANCIKKMPKNWMKQPAKGGKGIKYLNPKNPQFDYIRFMDKNLDKRAHLGQKEPYFIRLKDGNKYLTKEGKWVIEGTVEQAELHIPQSMFDELLPYMDF